MKRKTWTEELMKAEIRDVVETCGHFPSDSYLRSIGKGDLASQIQRKGGHVQIAAEMGLFRKESDSDVGWKGEVRLSKRLEAKGYEVAGNLGVKSPFDFIVNDVARVDVKSANYAEYGPCKGWFYRIGKYVQSDIVILHQLDTEDDYVFFWNEVTASNITISRSGGKYASFRNAYHKIDNLIAAIKPVISSL
jgi:hypothetical protein